MRRHLEKRIFPYTPLQVFGLVADVARYPEFLPWCVSADVSYRDASHMTAILGVGYKAFSDTFTSHVTLEPPGRITVDYGGGPLKHLKNEWHFEETGDGSCEVTFLVEFDFKSVLLGKMMDVFFETAFCRMVSAFVDRAEQLYGDR